MDSTLVAGGYAMSNTTYFVQECPICGRHLQIRVEYLGKRVVCRHCQGELTATDPTNLRCDSSEPAAALLRRADELLQSVAHQNVWVR
jgi:hypothetical protein